MSTLSSDGLVNVSGQAWGLGLGAVLHTHSHRASDKHWITTDLTLDRAYTKTASSADARAKIAKRYVFDDARIAGTSTVSSITNHPQTRRSLFPISKNNQDLC